jgi:tetratricopeptide (TPR) repeat protein
MRNSRLPRSSCIPLTHRRDGPGSIQNDNEPQAVRDKGCRSLLVDSGKGISMAKPFCSSCGAKSLAEARFCVECGEGLQAAATGSRAAFPFARYAPAIIIGVVLAVGGIAVYWGATSAVSPPTVPAAAPPAVPAAAPPISDSELPPGHPPMALPDDVRQAIDRLAEAAEKSPDNLTGWKQLGFAQYRAAQLDPAYLDPAAKTFGHILERDPDSVEALRGMGNVTFDQNDPEAAVTYYKRYLALKPDDLHVLTDLGTMYLAAKDVDQALRTYEAVLVEDPAFFQAQFNLAIALRAKGDNEAALAALQKARDVAADDATRQRVDAMLAHLAGGGSEAKEGRPREGLQADIESIFRSHPIAGPKVDRFDWTDERNLKVVMRAFPMEGMPPEVRRRFVERLQTGLQEKKQLHGSGETIEVQLVDADSGAVMETISQ